MRKISLHVKRIFMELVGYVFVFSFALSIPGGFFLLSPSTGLQKFGAVLVSPFVFITAAVLFPVILVQIFSFGKWAGKSFWSYCQKRGS